MSLVARRNLVHDHFRLALSAVGVALSIMLIILLDGFLEGLYAQVTTYQRHTAADIYIAQKGVVNMLGATSVLPQGTLEAVRQVEGTARVIPIVSQFIILSIHDKKVTSYLIGYDSALGGGPWALAEGREPASDDEMVIDRIMAKRHNLYVGDDISVLGRQMRIVGLSADTAAFMASFVFVRKAAAEAMLRAPGLTSFVLVSAAPGVTPTTLGSRLEAGVPGTGVMMARDISTNDIKLLARIFAMPLRLMVLIAFLVGTMVTGLVIYAATVERLREYGVLKAIGSSNRYLYSIVVQQALVASGIGLLLGIVLARATAQAIMLLLPQFLMIIPPTAVLQAAVASLGMGLLAAYIPARFVADLDPASIFRKG